MIYQFRVSLTQIKPEIWRRFQVDSSITFHQMHKTLQIIMGWDDYHLYEFELNNRLIGLPDPELFAGGPKIWNAKKERLEAHFTQEGQQGIYTYDFGDNWSHQLQLEKILMRENEETLPVCLEGERACPREDSGGIFGYLHMLEVIKDPNHPEYPDMVSWLEGDYQPEYFDLKEVNRILRRRTKSLNPKVN